MKCEKCGLEIPDGNKFCPNCGNEIGKKKGNVPTWVIVLCSLFLPPVGIFLLLCCKNSFGSPRKYITTLVVIIYMFTFWGSMFVTDNKSDTDSAQEVKPVVAEESIAGGAETEDIEQETENNQAGETNNVIINKKIYNKKGVTIKALEYDKKEHCIKFFIKNKSKLNLVFNAHAYSVNGLSTNNNIYTMDCNVPKGKKSNATLEIDNSFLRENDIEEVKYLEVLFWAYDNDKAFKSFDTDVIRINISGEKNSKYISGDNIYDKNGVSVDYLNQDDYKYKFVITNKTGDYFGFDVDNISVNDYMVQDIDFDLIGVVVFDKNQGIFTIELDDDFLSDNGIKKVKNISFTININIKEKYSNSWSTETIQLSLKK